MTAPMIGLVAVCWIVVTFPIAILVGRICALTGSVDDHERP